MQKKTKVIVIANEKQETDEKLVEQVKKFSYIEVTSRRHRKAITKCNETNREE